MAETNESVSKMAVPNKKQRVYEQSFRDEWLQDPLLKDWLQRYEKDNSLAYCKVCDHKLSVCHRGVLINHQKTKKHIDRFRTNQSTLKIPTLFSKKENESNSLETKVARAELLISSFIAEHNTPFLHVDHLVEVCKKAFPECVVAQNMKLKHTKTTYVVRHGIAHYEKQKIEDVCKTQKFSFLIDESTDISVNQILAVVVLFLDESAMVVRDSLLNLVEVENGTSKRLYDSVKELFENKGIPLTNRIGFGSDNCSTMMGVHGGFQAHLKREVPNVYVLGCICHSFALCANAASSLLPSWLETFVKNACFYFSKSSKRNHEFELLQEAAEAPRHRILKLAQTMEAVVTRLIEQVDALKLYFQSQSATDRVEGARQLFQVMSTAGTKHMLLFLAYVLEKSEHFKSRVSV